jgi:hypothetical protein
MNTEAVLIDSFRAIERKHAGLQSATGDEARDCIRARLQESANAPDIQEFQCTLKNDWEGFVLHALLKRYGIPPYRYRKQRKSTVLVRVSKRFMNELLWPIFQEVSAVLYARFNEILTTLLPAIALGPFSMAILEHDHSAGHLCENCRQRLLESS